MRRMPTRLLIALAVVFIFCTSHLLAQDKDKRTGVVDRLLDWSLRNAGIDPDSEDAKNAKQLGKDGMNPFASQEHIDEDIQRIARSVVGGEEAVDTVLNDPNLDSEAKRERLRSLFGNAKTCPYCTKVFPFDYLYCPYDRHALHIAGPRETKPLTGGDPAAIESLPREWGPDLVNKANGCRIHSTSEYFRHVTEEDKDRAGGPENLMDGSLNAWNSSSARFPHWIVFDLGKEVTIRRVGFINHSTGHRGSEGANFSRDIEVWGSADAKEYVPLGKASLQKGSGSNPPAQNNVVQSFVCEPAMIRYLKVMILSNYFDDSMYKKWPGLLDTCGVSLAEVLAFER